MNVRLSLVLTSLLGTAVLDTVHFVVQPRS